jgi:hypothetical protein
MAEIDLALRAAQRRYNRLLKAFTDLQRVAQDVLDETDRNLNHDTWPIKYRAPYGALMKLRKLLARQRGLR